MPIGVSTQGPDPSSYITGPAQGKGGFLSKALFAALGALSQIPQNMSGTQGSKSFQTGHFFGALIRSAATTGFQFAAEKMKESPKQQEMLSSASRTDSFASCHIGEADKSFGTVDILDAVYEVQLEEPLGKEAIQEKADQLQGLRAPKGNGEVMSREEAKKLVEFIESYDGLGDEVVKKDKGPDRNPPYSIFVQNEGGEQKFYILLKQDLSGAKGEIGHGSTKDTKLAVEYGKGDAKPRFVASQTVALERDWRNGVREERGLLREIEVIRKQCGVNVPHIRYSGKSKHVAGETTKYNIILPLASEGDLYSFNKADPKVCQQIALSAGAIIQSLHREEVAVGDVKPKNILVNKRGEGDYEAIICDFGHSRDKSQVVGKPGTPGFGIEGDGSTGEQLDVYAFGVTLLQMMGPRREPSIPLLAAEMMDKNPAKRPSMDQVMAQLGEMGVESF